MHVATDVKQTMIESENVMNRMIRTTLDGLAIIEQRKMGKHNSVISRTRSDLNREHRYLASRRVSNLSSVSLVTKPQK